MQRDDDIAIPSLTLDQDDVSERKAAAVETPKKIIPEHKPAPDLEQSQSKPNLVSVYVLIIMIVFLSAGAVYWLWQQNKQLRDEIYGARSQIQNLDHQLIAADISANEQGQTIEETLKTHNSEIRKLWGVAYDRNRKTIAANKTTIEALEKKLASMESSEIEQSKVIASQAASLKSQQAEYNKLAPNISSLDSTVEKVDSVVKSLARVQEDNTKQLQAVTTRVNAETKTNAEQASNLSKTQQGLLAIEERISTLENVTADISAADLVSIQSSLASHQDAINSNDAFRIQVNAEIIRLRKQINQLMLEQQISTQ